MTLEVGSRKEHCIRVSRGQRHTFFLYLTSRRGVIETFDVYFIIYVLIIRDA